MRYFAHTIIYRSIRFFLRRIKEKYNTVYWESLSYNKKSNNLDRLGELRNKYAGYRCFVIGNGPSLRKVDFKFLKNEITLTCNGFVKLLDEIELDPTYYFAEDVLVFRNFGNYIKANLDHTLKIFPIDVKKYHYDDQTIYVNFLRSYMYNRNKRFPVFSTDFFKRVYYGRTVAFMMLQFAYYIGCKEIYLLGIDLNYSIPENAVRKGNLLVFRENSDVNHFYIGEENKKIWGFIPDNDVMQNSFDKADAELAKKGVKLFNATMGGNLHNINKVNFNELFNEN